MGSVQGYAECPRCHKDQCHEDYNYKTGETNQICFDCGYIHQVNYKRDEEGNYVMKDPTQGLLFSNLVIEEIKIDDPYGVVITFKENMGGQINTLRTKEDYEQIVKACKENTDDRIQSVIVKRYIQGEEGKKGRFKKIELLSSEDKTLN